MGGKREKPEDIVLKLRQVEVLQYQGKPLADAVRQIGVTVQTYYRWRKEYGGMSRDQLKRLKLLEAENTRLSQVHHGKTATVRALMRVFEMSC